VKADRLPRWAFRRLTAEQKDAYNELRWHGPGPARRARLKLVLGWKRTHEEAVALARELAGEGRSRKAIADHLGVTDRHLRRLLADPPDAGVRTREKQPANAVAKRYRADTTCETRVDDRPRPPAAGFANGADLDRWLEDCR
jgi:hypothetical protein